MLADYLVRAGIASPRAGAVAGRRCSRGRPSGLSRMPGTRLAFLSPAGLQGCGRRRGCGRLSGGVDLVVVGGVGEGGGLVDEVLDPVGRAAAVVAAGGRRWGARQVDVAGLDLGARRRARGDSCPFGRDRDHPGELAAQLVDHGRRRWPPPRSDRVPVAAGEALRDPGGQLADRLDGLGEVERARGSGAAGSVGADRAPGLADDVVGAGAPLKVEVPALDDLVEARQAVSVGVVPAPPGASEDAARRRGGALLELAGGAVGAERALESVRASVGPSRPGQSSSPG